jgi:hypothetical protein
MWVPDLSCRVSRFVLLFFSFLSFPGRVWFRLALVLDLLVGYDCDFESGCFFFLSLSFGRNSALTDTETAWYFYLAFYIERGLGLGGIGLDWI